MGHALYPEEKLDFISNQTLLTSVNPSGLVRGLIWHECVALTPVGFTKKKLAPIITEMQ